MEDKPSEPKSKLNTGPTTDAERAIMRDATKTRDYSLRPGEINTGRHIGPAIPFDQIGPSTQTVADNHKKLLEEQE
jgi:hypothetical protein